MATAEVVEGDIPTLDFAKGTVPKEDRKPHFLLPIFWERVRAGTSTKFTRELLELVRAVESAVKKEDSEFVSPLSSSKTASWGQYAHKRAPKNPIYEFLEHMYES